MTKEWLSGVGLLLLRVMAGFGLASHGYQKIFGGHMVEFTRGVEALGFPIPLFFAWAAALSEFLGGILVAIGLKTRLAAAFAFITMAVAAFMAHASSPFRTKELAIIYMAIFGAVLMMGGGKFSLDRH